MARRPPPRITRRWLQRKVLTYLQRYSTTSAHLRRVLMRHVYRSAAYHEEDPAEGAALVDAQIDQLIRNGLLDDARFATDRARALHRRGNAKRAIRAKLAAKGLYGAVVDQALDALSEDGGDPDLVAARHYARKRRIGPFRERTSRLPADEQRRKDLARMARAGFSFDVARRILDG